MKKSSRSSSQLILLLTGVSSLVLLAGCDFAKLKNPFADPRPEQRLEGQRHPPVLNSLQASQLGAVQPPPPLAASPVASNTANAPSHALVVAAARQDPYDSYNPNGTTPPPVAAATSAPQQDTMFGRMFTGSPPKKEEMVRKPLPGNPYYGSNNTIETPTMGADRRAPAPLTTQNIAPEPVAVHTETEETVTRPAQPSLFTRIFGQPSKTADDNLPPPWKLRDVNTVQTSVKPARGGDAAAMADATAPEEPATKEMPTWADRWLGKSGEKSSMEAEQNAPYPALSSVPPAPQEFNDLKASKQQSMQDLQAEHAQAVRDKNGLDSEPSQQPKNMTPVDMPSASADMGKAPMVAAPVQDNTMMPEAAPAMQPPAAETTPVEQGPHAPRRGIDIMTQEQWEALQKARQEGRSQPMPDAPAPDTAMPAPDTTQPPPIPLGPRSEADHPARGDMASAALSDDDAKSRNTLVVTQELKTQPLPEPQPDPEDKQAQAENEKPTGEHQSFFGRIFATPAKQAKPEADSKQQAEDKPAEPAKSDAALAKQDMAPAAELPKPSDDNAVADNKNASDWLHALTTKQAPDAAPSVEASAPEAAPDAVKTQDTSKTQVLGEMKDPLIHAAQTAPPTSPETEAKPEIAEKMVVAAPEAKSADAEVAPPSDSRPFFARLFTSPVRKAEPAEEAKKDVENKAPVAEETKEVKQLEEPKPVPVAEAPKPKLEEVRQAEEPKPETPSASDTAKANIEPAAGEPAPAMAADQPTSVPEHQSFFARLFAKPAPKPDSADTKDQPPQDAKAADNAAPLVTPPDTNAAAPQALSAVGGPELPPLTVTAAPVTTVNAGDAAAGDQGSLPSPHILQEIKMLPPSRYSARMRTLQQNPDEQ